MIGPLNRKKSDENLHISPDREFSQFWNRGNVTYSADIHTSLPMTDSHLIQILLRFNIGFPQILKTYNSVIF